MKVRGNKRKTENKKEKVNYGNTFEENKSKIYN